jgi:hypothetical protein
VGLLAIVLAKVSPTVFEIFKKEKKERKEFFFSPKLLHPLFSTPIPSIVMLLRSEDAKVSSFTILCSL